MNPFEGVVGADVFIVRETSNKNKELNRHLLAFRANVWFTGQIYT